MRRSKGKGGSEGKRQKGKDRERARRQTENGTEK